MAPRKFNEKKAVEMLEKHALKTMWGRIALREAREKIEDYVYLKNSMLVSLVQLLMQLVD